MLDARCVLAELRCRLCQLGCVVCVSWCVRNGVRIAIIFSEDFTIFDVLYAPTDETIRRAYEVLR